MIIDQEAARNFVLALNNIAGYVPPMLFQPVITNSVAIAIQDVCNGRVTVEIRDVQPIEPPPANGAGRRADQEIISRS